MVPAVRRAALIVYSTYPVNVDNVLQLFRGYPTWEVIIELAIIWACVYLVFRFLQGTRGAGVIMGFTVLIIVLVLLFQLLGDSSGAFGRIKYISNQVLGLLAILLIVVFQPELRQAMIRVGAARLLGRRNPQMDRLADAITEAVEFLSKNSFGALIVIERGGRLGGLIEGGVRIDALVTPRLIEAIFWPNSPLHDLAVVVRGDRVVAASVQLPLAETGEVPAQLGSRHRAAVGVTTESDCLVVIVSEETGNCRLAEHGSMTPPLDRAEFRTRLMERLQVEPEASKAEPVVEVES